MRLKVQWPCRPLMLTEVVLRGTQVYGWDPVADAWMPCDHHITDAQIARVRRAHTPRRVRIRVAFVGHNYAVVGQVVALNGRTISEGPARPRSCPEVARRDAEGIITHRGWVLVQPEETQ